MSRLKSMEDRCRRCFMRQEHCICTLIPELLLPSKLVLVISKRELRVPTNTGRLAALALPNSTILRHGDLDHPYDLREHLLPGIPTFLLYPSPDAVVLDAAWRSSFTGPCNLVVPDGNWRQTVKMRRRDPHMASLPVVTLAPGTPSQYRVRQETKAEGLATIEAIARAFGVIEGAAVQGALEQVFHAMVARTLTSRGVTVGEAATAPYE